MSYDKSFIEVQFPVSKISKESYKERKAVQGQTLTGLGKWWGRKPLLLVRATIIAGLMPVSNNPKKDMDIFLKLLCMDNDGLLRRKKKAIPLSVLLANVSENDKEKYFQKEDNIFLAKFREDISKVEKDNLQKKVFWRLTYDEKLKYMIRPEEIQTTQLDWKSINEHLKTDANSINELINQLGMKNFKRVPKVGDCFAGGGSIPFEAARIGCDTVAYDLNPIASLLTWSALNIAGANNDKIQLFRGFQKKVYRSVSTKIDRLDVETNEKGWRANAYLYCTEVVCPECGYKVPLSPTWIIGNGTSSVAVKIIENNSTKSYEFKIIEDATKEEIYECERHVTLRDYNLVCPKCKQKTPIPSIRKDNNDGEKREFRYNTPNSLRKWNKEDFDFHDSDIYTERLYCIRYEENIDKNGKNIVKRHYISPTIDDINRELIVKNFIKSKLSLWQEAGIISSNKIEAGWNTNQLIYEKGWTHWHHLYNPRQLLIIGLFIETINELADSKEEFALGILGVNKICNWNSRLSRWDNGKSPSVKDIFYNQSFNTLFNYGCRGLSLCESIWFFNINGANIQNSSDIITVDARKVDKQMDMWITDPPYADAVNYHELTELFLAWDKGMLSKSFDQWYCDSKRILAIKGTGEDFNKSMIEVYSNLAKNTSSNGLQVVMFTHSDVKVWAELSMILWSSGLQVTAAWNIATETESGGLKNGNYVKGTVLLVLRKQIATETAYLDELYSEIEDEVKDQIESMRALDDKEDPNFSDPDYLLAAYAASLKILTSYKNIEDIDVKYELSKARSTSEISPIENIINQAVKIAYDYLIPSEFDSFIWKSLIPEERLYLKGIELEKQNLYQLAAYQELARGFGVDEYTTMLASTKANTARLKTPKEFAVKNLNDSSTFGNSLLRNILVAIHLGLKEEDTSKGRNWLKTEVTDYWNKRSSIIEILNYLSKAEYIDNMKHWKECAHEAFILMNLVENDNI